MCECHFQLVDFPKKIPYTIPISLVVSSNKPKMKIYS